MKNAFSVTFMVLACNFAKKKKKSHWYFQNTYFSAQIWASAFVFAGSQENEQDTFYI